MAVNQAIRRSLPIPLGNLLKSLNWYRWVLSKPERLREHLAVRRRRQAFDATQRSLASDEMRLRSDLQLRVSPAGRAGYEHFCWESKRMINELDLFIAESSGRQVLFDVGALHGLFSLTFSSGGRLRRAFAFEPSPLAYPILEEHIGLNPRCDVKGIQLAIGDKAGQLTMEYDWQHLVARGEGASATGKTVTVPMRSLDQICEQEQVWPDIIKIDIEGFEYFALLGAAELLRTRRPVLFIEVHKSLLARHGVTLEAVWQLLKQYRYSIEDITVTRCAAPNPPTGDVEVMNLLCTAGI